jgi:citrate lyase beta subunit
MLQKSLSNPSDVIIYDLEDSVAPQEKVNARHKLSEFLQVILTLSCLVVSWVFDILRH